MIPKKLFNSENAVSEVIDVVFILGIMFFAISLIGTSGYPFLQNMQENGHTENIKQSYIVLSENMNKVVFGNAPSQSVELKMYGGGIWVTGDSVINVTVQTWNSSLLPPAIESQTFSHQTREIQNEYEGTLISYENTGVWAKYENGGTVMVKEPEFVFSDNTLFIPSSTISGVGGHAGEGLVRAVADGGESSVYKYTNVSAVDITIMSQYYDGWEKYLDDTFGMKIISRDENNNTIQVRKDDYLENIDVYILYSPLSVRIE
jgi:hypothetical protein